MLYGANGQVVAERHRVAIDPELLKMIAALAEFSSDLSLGLHCSRCQQDLRGVNGHGDARWAIECGCRTFVGRNPFTKDQAVC